MRSKHHNCHFGNRIRLHPRCEESQPGLGLGTRNLTKSSFSHEHLPGGRSTPCIPDTRSTWRLVHALSQLLQTEACVLWGRAAPGERAGSQRSALARPSRGSLRQTWLGVPAFRCAPWLLSLQMPWQLQAAKVGSCLRSLNFLAIPVHYSPRRFASIASSNSLWLMS